MLLHIAAASSHKCNKTLSCSIPHTHKRRTFIPESWQKLESECVPSDLFQPMPFIQAMLKYLLASSFPETPTARSRDLVFIAPYKILTPTRLLKYALLITSRILPLSHSHSPLNTVAAKIIILIIIVKLEIAQLIRLANDSPLYKTLTSKRRWQLPRSPVASCNPICSYLRRYIIYRPCHR